MLLLPSLKPTFILKERGSGLASTSSAPLVASPCGGLPCWRGRIWVQVCLSGGLLIIPLPTPLLPTQVQKFLLGLKNNLPSPSILDKKWPSAPYKYFNTANHELQRLFHQWKVSGAWVALLAPGQLFSSFVFFLFSFLWFSSSASLFHSKNFFCLWW